jgi:predicted membrane protein
MEYLIFFAQRQAPSPGEELFGIGLLILLGFFILIFGCIIVAALIYALFFTLGVKFFTKIFTREKPKEQIIIQSKSEEINIPECPICRRNMIKKIHSSKKKMYWVCVDYPRCHGLVRIN